jgi:hypothetical protein
MILLLLSTRKRRPENWSPLLRHWRPYLTLPRQALPNHASPYQTVPRRFYHRFVLLRAFRGRPTFRSFTASRSFGSISHIIPILIAFKRPRAIMARTLLGVTFNRFAASAVLMSFTVQSIPFRRNGAPAQQFLLTSEDLAPIVPRTNERAGKCV